MNCSRGLAFCGTFLLLVHCGVPRTPARAVVPQPPMWHSTAADGTPAGRLRAQWEESIHQTMEPYDALMSGRALAYRGFASIAGKQHGPMYGVVRVDVVDGTRFRRVRLEGKNVSLEMVPATSRQPSVFVFWSLIHGGEHQITCDDCIAADAPEIDFSPLMTFSPRNMTLDLVPPQGEVVHGHIIAGVELQQIDQHTIDVSLAKTLWPVLARAKAEGDQLVLEDTSEVWVNVPKPSTVDAAHSMCEIYPAAPAAIVIDSQHLASWQIRFPSQPPRRVCCEREAEHGPSRSQYSPNDCVDVP